MPTRRLRHTFTRASQMFLACLLALIVSGAPHAMAVVANHGEPPCATDCGDEDEKGACTPLCAQGACAKVFPTVPAPFVVAVVVSLVVTATPLAPVVVIDAPHDGVAVAVFHPPRA